MAFGIRNCELGKWKFIRALSIRACSSQTDRGNDSGRDIVDQRVKFTSTAWKALYIHTYIYISDPHNDTIGGKRTDFVTSSEDGQGAPGAPNGNITFVYDII